MNSLAALQAKIQQYICVDSLATAEQDPALDFVGPYSRAEIYAQAYPARLLEALADNYPKLQALLGETQFNEMGLAYLAQFPSRHYSVRWFGEALASFIQYHESYSQVPVLDDLAKFEWALTLAFDAQNAKIMAVEEIAAFAPESWPQMVFIPHPSVQLLPLVSNAPVIWQALQDQQIPPDSIVSANSQAWLIWREGITVYFRAAQSAEAVAFRALMEAKPFSAICQSMLEVAGSEQATHQAASLLQTWMSSGLITSVHISNA